MRGKDLKVLSLFDGISSAYLALKQAGFSVDKYYASEINKYAIAIAKSNQPDTIQLGDIVKWREWDIEQPDLICAGSPCQGFSFAGKQLNFNDPRSALFFEFVDILKHYRPKYFLLENVKMKKEYQDVISQLLGCEPIEINSALVSAQNRKRLYWTNIPGIEQPTDKRLSMGDIWADERDITDRVALKRPGTKAHLKTYQSMRRMDQTANCLLAGGQRINNSSATNVIKNGRYYSPGIITCERLQTLPDNYTNHVSNTQRYKAIGNSWTVEVVVHIFKKMQFNY